MVVLSLFDGISCGLVALDRAGIKVTKYYASEVDKFAMRVSANNHPKIVQLGDINNWESWDIEKPDLIIGGSPCQGFSRSGKGLGFKDDRSKLFWEFVKIVKHYKPAHFLLENVVMKKQDEAIISKALGVSPVLIDSSLVSAQSRKRLYWCNFNVTQPDNKHIYLKDVLESGDVDKDKSYCIDANYWKGGDLNQYINKRRRQLIFETLQKNGTLDIKSLEQHKRAYEDVGKSPTLTAHSGGNHQVKVLRVDDLNNYKIRKLTPLECERLQTLPDNYTQGLSNTQRYKCVGNGWTVDVIAHILKCAYD